MSEQEPVQDTYTVPTIIDIVIQNLGLEKYALVLTPNEKTYIQSVLREQPEILTNIQATIQDIVSDGKIDLHDIPKIVLLVSQIMKNHIIENAVRNVSVISVVKFLVDSILDSGLLPLPKVEIDLLRRVFDSSIELLQMETKVDFKMKCCCTC